MIEFDQFKKAALDLTFRSRLMSLNPGLKSRCDQISYFNRVKGPKCSYVDAGIRLLRREIRELGYDLREGGIVISPGGKQLWPMK